MRSVVACVIAAALVTSVGSANAAPPSKSSGKAPIGVTVDWTGFYFGASGGYANGEWDGRARTIAGGNPADFDTGFLPTNHRTLEADGWLGGLQIGYNQQVSKIVFGIEADFSFTEFDGDETYRTRNFLAGQGGDLFYDKAHKPKLDYFGTVRGRLGYDFAGILPFVTGGLAWGKTDAHLQVDQFSGGVVWARGWEINEASGRVDEEHVGWTAGAGVEGKVAAGWSLKAEWLHVDLGQEDYLFVGAHNIGPLAGQPFATDSFPADLEFDVYRIGFNYHFGAAN